MSLELGFKFAKAHIRTNLIPSLSLHLVDGYKLSATVPMSFLAATMLPMMLEME